MGEYTKGGPGGLRAIDQGQFYRGYAEPRKRRREILMEWG